MMTGLKFPGLFSSPSPLLMKFRPEKLKNQKAKCSKKIERQIALFCFQVADKGKTEATKFCEIFPLLLTVLVKSKGKISQNFVAFSEYIYFTERCF